MSQCKNSTLLGGPAASVGLFADVGDLAHGPVKLRLQGRYHCHDVDRPFYKFEILDAQTDEAIGEITFMPETDVNLIAAMGHSGGGLVEAAKGNGAYGHALRALAPLAGRHGLNEFMIAFGEDNAPAIAAAEKLKFTKIESFNQQARYMVIV